MLRHGSPSQPTARPTVELRSPALLFALVAALVVATGGIALFAGGKLLDGRNNVVPAPMPTATSSLAVSTPGAPTQPAPTRAAQVWTVERLDVSALNDRAFTSALAYANGRYVAVGGRDCDWPNPAACWGGVWTSADGVSWAKLERSGALAVSTDRPLSGPEPGLLDVAGGPDGFIAIGYGLAGAAVWHSRDGLTWDLPPSASVFKDARLHAAAATPAGWAVVGEVFEAPIRSGTPRAAIWTSADGMGWDRVPDGPMFDIGGYFDTMEEPGSGGIEDVASDGTTVVAVGDACDEVGKACVQATWRSTDGTSWKRVSDGMAGALTSVAGNDLGFVAVGAECQGAVSYCDPFSSPIAKHSRDGKTWATAQTPPFDGRLGPVCGGEGFFTVLRQPEHSGTLHLDASADGVEWEPVPAWESEPVWARGVGMAADGAGRVILLGWSETDAGFPSFGASITVAP